LWHYFLLAQSQQTTIFRLSQESFAIHQLNVSPSAKIATSRYLFCLSRDVYGGNRSFTSYTKTKMVESAVLCLLTRLDDGDSQQVTGSKYLNTVQDQK
jgi:hypothetical protein